MKRVFEQLKIAPDSHPLESAGERRWYAVYTQPHRESRADVQLQTQGFRTFLPRRLKTIRHARKLTNVPAPTFPRYLFVELDLNRDRWRSVNGTFGVTTLVMRGELPHPVPRGVVEAMLASVDEKGFFIGNEDSLRVGTQVRLLAGPFAEKLATLHRLDDGGRVRVLLEIMGASIPVQVERKYVMSAD